MENSYAESGDSSPRSRDIDCENSSWEEQPSNYKVKFMCSYGGKIQPRAHDHQLTYNGGDTKILSVDRTIKYSDLMNKVSSFCDSDVVFKYQLPGEDLDALISVTNDEDLEHMMAEYDRVHRITPKPPRLRVFLFRLAPKSYDSNESKPNQQWLADAMNSVPIQSLDSSAVETPNAQDFLFGLDRIGGRGAEIATGVNVNPPAAKLPETEIQGTFPTDTSTRSDSGIDNRNVAEPVVSPTISQVEIQRQIHELQKLQIANQEQAMFRKNSDEALARAFHGDYSLQNVPEKGIPVPAPGVPMSNPVTYWQDINGNYTTGPVTGNEHPVYLIPSPVGIYQTSTTVQPVTGPSPTGMYQASTTAQPVTGPPPTGMYQTQPAVQPVNGQIGQAQVGQNYYAMQRVQPEVYREQPMYSVGPPQPKIIARPGGGMAVPETGYTQVAYDTAGRPVFYTAAPGSVAPPSSYQTVVGTGGVDLRQVAPLNVNQEGKVATTAAV